jgi:hypothetical protein
MIGQTICHYELTLNRVQKEPEVILNGAKRSEESAILNQILRLT